MALTFLEAILKENPEENVLMIDGPDTYWTNGNILCKNDPYILIQSKKTNMDNSTSIYHLGISGGITAIEKNPKKRQDMKDALVKTQDFTLMSSLSQESGVYSKPQDTRELFELFKLQDGKVIQINTKFTEYLRVLFASKFYFNQNSLRVIAENESGEIVGAVMPAASFFTRIDFEKSPLTLKQVKEQQTSQV